MNFQGLFAGGAACSPFLLEQLSKSLKVLYNKDIHKYKNRQYLKVKISL